MIQETKDSNRAKKKIHDEEVPVPVAEEDQEKEDMFIEYGEEHTSNVEEHKVYISDLLERNIYCFL